MKESFNQFMMRTWDGKLIDPSYVRYRDMKSIVINVASKCGYTDDNYKQLVEFANTVKDKVSIYLFPCNDFGQQEPGDIEEIVYFCDQYGLTDLYPTVKIMGKTSVVDEENELFQWLQYNNEMAKSGLDFGITWNFHKFLINTDGSMWGFCYPDENLNDPEIIEWVNTKQE